MKIIFLKVGWIFHHKLVAIQYVQLHLSNETDTAKPTS